MRGTTILTAVANGFAWLTFTVALLSEHHRDTPWFVAPLLVLGVVLAIVGTAVFVASEDDGRRVGMGILIAATVGGIVVIVLAFVAGDSWGAVVLPIMPLLITTHVLWIASPAAGMLLEALQRDYSSSDPTAPSSCWAARWTAG